MKSTIKDVAALAGVSFKTVSRVINKEKSVKADTFEKVTQAIQSLNYQPNTAARNLAGTRSFTIGFVYDNPNAFYVIDMQNGIISQCREKGYELLIHPCESTHADITTEIQQMVKRTQLSGLVICPPLSENNQIMTELSALDIQFVRVVSGTDDTVDNTSCIFIHDRQAAISIVEYLISLGHKKIAFISGDKDHKSTLERRDGYLDAMKLHGLDVNPDWIVEGRYSFDSGMTSAQQLLKIDDRPTAIFACNDEIAAGALLAAKQGGFDIPAQLSIAGFEDSPFSRQTIPQLTTAAQPTKTIATFAAQLLISNISENRLGVKPTEPRHRSYIPKLVVRGSTAKLS